MFTDERPDVLTPSQLNTLARDMLEGGFPSVWIEAELGNVARPASGHLYLTLKDERAQVRAAMFRSQSARLRFQPRQGMRVLVRGRVTLYEARGEFQMVLEHMEEAGEGALRRAFEELKARLQAEGLFDPERKRPLPAYARRVGIITSATGAAVRDVLSVLGRRFPMVEAEVLPVPVQGEGAAARITAMLQRAGHCARYDVLVLARASAASPVPVVSAIGHETDFSLADFAADVRAPTPSVAAELLVPSREDLERRVQLLSNRLEAVQRHQLQRAMQRADRAALRLNACRPQARMELLCRRQAEALRRLRAACQRQLDRDQARLRHAGVVLQAGHPQRRLSRLRERLAMVSRRPQAVVVRRLENHALHLRGLARSLEATSPLATIARGYSITTREDGQVIRNVADVAPGDPLLVRVSDGTLPVQVINTRRAQ